jgi:phage terminase large subunit-like protein
MGAAERQILAAIKKDPRLAVRYATEIIRRQRNQDGDVFDFYSFRPLPKQQPVLTSKKDVVAFCTANQVGKSTTGGFWMACRLQNYNPVDPTVTYPKPGRYWACTKGDLIDGLMSKVEQFLDPKEIAWIRRSPGKQQIRMKNGRWVKFKSYDQSRAAYQQESLNDLWNDEEPPEEIWQEQQTRLIRFAGQTLLTFTPVDGSVWMHKVLFDDENESWVDTFKMSMKDNTWLPAERVEKYIRQFQGDPDQLAIRVEGDYRLMVGSGVFDRDCLADAWKTTKEPAHRWVIDQNGEYAPAGDGDLNIWQVWEEPRKGDIYSIGSDIANGGIHGDWTTALVYNVSRGTFDALYRGKVDPYDWGDELGAAGKLWNGAVVAPEVNGPGSATISRLQHLNYRALYRRERHGGAARRLTTTEGWLTNGPSKQFMVGQFRQAFNEGMVGIPMAPLLDEMRRFVWLRKDQPGMFGCAASSGNDDIVIGACIAYQAASQAGRRSYLRGRTSDEILVQRLEAMASVDDTSSDDEDESWD